MERSTPSRKATAKATPKKSQDFVLHDFEMPAIKEDDGTLPGADLSIDQLFSAADENATLPASEKSSEDVEATLTEKDAKESDASAKAIKEALQKEREAEEKMKKEYLAIFDTLMFEGHYEETIPLGKNYKALLRTRTTREDSDISKRLDAMNFKTAIAYQNMASIMTLMYSLRQFNEINLTEMNIQDRYTYLCGLPGPVLVLLSNKLFEFDQKILEAVSYGKENF